MIIDKLKYSTIDKIKINLTDEEYRLFGLLRRCLKATNTVSTLRVAGGWVRDKLLGKESDDIDIAICNMTGYQFALRLHAYLVAEGHVASNVNLIKANPEQSKHLETATIRIGDRWVDFANLRKEVYYNHSRIPKMEFGTPYEDA